jgi:syntaxin 1B/2/3
VPYSISCHFWRGQIEDPNDNLYATEIVMTGQQLAGNALADVIEKHAAIVKLARSVQELHELFVDMATLVEAQGELLTQIEHHVVTAVEYAETGVKELVKAKKLQQAARKKMVAVACCLMIILAIVLVPVLLKFTGGS